MFSVLHNPCFSLSLSSCSVFHSPCSVCLMFPLSDMHVRVISLHTSAYSFFLFSVSDTPIRLPVPCSFNLSLFHVPISSMLCPPLILFLWTILCIVHVPLFPFPHSLCSLFSSIACISFYFTLLFYLFVLLFSVHYYSCGK
jgi:hypothetical protein